MIRKYEMEQVYDLVFFVRICLAWGKYCNLKFLMLLAQKLQEFFLYCEILYSGKWLLLLGLWFLSCSRILNL